MADKFDEVTEEMRSLLNGEEIVEADPENKYRKRRVVLGVLTGILVLLLAGFCFFTMVYMPNKAFQGLDEIDSGYKAYRDALDELKDINATQKTAEDMTDESEYPQGVMVDSNEAEASKPSKLLPLATTIDGRPISTAPAGPWEGPKDK